jgi:DNA-binding response OmpR family regulator
MNHLSLGEAMDLLHQIVALQSATADCIQRLQTIIEHPLSEANGATHRAPIELPLIDQQRLCVQWKNKTCSLGATIPLRLLERLCRRPNCFVSQEDLLRDVWNGVKTASTVRSTIRRLKRRLESAGMTELARVIHCAGGRYALMASSLP